MARKKKTYTIVSVEDGIKLVSLGYESLDAVSDFIAKREPGEGDVLLFEGAPIPFEVSRKPTVTIGAPRVRAKKATAGKPGRKPKAPLMSAAHSATDLV